ncbi:MAG: heavy metal translocating P-type ATPase metal-binding domain-containing protein [Flavobacteriaceae bacterium]|nr:heavy metal translocating P-type ATPase metal-binding domain-containing protein [Flavobacteriaceae bacterium]
MSDDSCYHCGAPCKSINIKIDDKSFCCNGCKTVFEILNQSNLHCYYDLTNNPGIIPSEIKGKYNYLENSEIVSKLLEFDDGNTAIIQFNIPSIHCSSCIWVLENLSKLNPDIRTTLVNFQNKTVHVTFSSKETTLKEIVELMTSIGYEPYISLEDASSGKKKQNRHLTYQVAVAGFAFGNIMLMSLPEYFQMDEFWLNQFKPFFRGLMFVFALPVLLYSAQNYFISAFKGLKNKILNIDVPIALGISVLFMRSTFDIVFNLGQGYFDSFSGLVFFLLIGKIFQQRTYNFLSFERDYKSYFPIAITKIGKDRREQNIPVYDIKKGDRLLVRHQELVPVDGILINGDALLDYSFVTGEANPVIKQSGDKIFAGGKQMGSSFEMDVLETMSQSYLTQLWSNDIFKKKKTYSIKSLTDAISKKFTFIILSIALISGLYWFFIDPTEAFNVVTAVLIIACPCALALAAPFALGNMLRLFGKNKLYLKNANIIEDMAKIDTLVFDKTGTLTTNKSHVKYNGELLSDKEKSYIKSLLRNSNHTLSRKLYDFIKEEPFLDVTNFKEEIGKGISGNCEGMGILLGSSLFVESNEIDTILQTAIWVKINNKIKGKFIFENTYRKDLQDVFKKLQQKFRLIVLSGDNEGEKERLRKLLPNQVAYYFNQKPQQKLDFIKDLQLKGKNVMMIGDGLNDAGALAQSDVGLAVSEDINIFSPACDGIIDAKKFRIIPNYLKLAKNTVLLIKISFIISFIYNTLGMYFAIQGLLSPIVAAILMPLSSISVVIFVSLGTGYLVKKTDICH